jgi:Flp pilus assembly protein TadG
MTHATRPLSRTGLKNSFVARLKRCEARRGKRGKKPEVYPLRYTEDFFTKFDEVAARISSTAAEDIFETGSTKFSSAGDAGAVAIEFILVTPLILVMLGFALRLTQLIEAYQIAMVFSREAATETARQCTDITILSRYCTSSSQSCVDQDATTAATEQCLPKVRAKYQSLWTTGRPTTNPSASTARIDVEVYRYDITNLSIPEDCSTPDATISRFSTNKTLNQAAVSNQSMCLRNRIARARISFTVRVSTAFLGLLPGVLPSEVEIVDDTVL